MKKVTAFIGTQTRKNTYQAVQEFERNLKQLGEIDFDYVFLSDYQLDFCRGCKVCFVRGEEYCPIKGDRDVLLDKMEHSDGIIFATPNYAFQVSARMKNFIDHLAYIYHRPRFFGKACTAIVVQGIFGGGAILRYLSMTGENLGFHVSRGCCVTALDPMTGLQQKKLTRDVKKASARFYKELLRPTPAPSFLRLMAFRMARTNIKFIDQKYRDYQYYNEKGWFETDYYYPVSLGFVKRRAGNLFDFLGRRMVKQPSQVVPN